MRTPLGKYLNLFIVCGIDGNSLRMTYNVFLMYLNIKMFRWFGRKLRPFINDPICLNNVGKNRQLKLRKPLKALTHHLSA